MSPANPSKHQNRENCQGQGEQRPVQIDADGSSSAPTTRKHPCVWGNLAVLWALLFQFGLIFCFLIPFYFFKEKQHSLPLDHCPTGWAGQAAAGSPHTEPLSKYGDTGEEPNKAKGPNRLFWS